MIEIEGVIKSFSGKIVLNNICLTVNKGQSFCILGPNGAGKSTLINLLLGIFKPDKGVIRINGLQYGRLSIDNKIKQIIGGFGDESKLIDEFTGYDYLQFVSYLYNIERSIQRSRIENVTNFFFDDISSLNRKITTYSTGMRKKLEICASILHLPLILILDEPFSGLDILSAEKLTQFIKTYISVNSNRLVFFSSHDLYYVNKAATHIGVLNKGEIIFSNSIENFKNNTDSVGQSLLDTLQIKADSFTDSLSWIQE